ncbi:hypothetical protein H0B56_16995 [Haloechinothrix sp. YIM 98757]|uniref:Threonine dehydrogenase n=1 Tax=Haloechinothrix aidingensis TaxID=2752311 RepID=A0A838ADE5_9PSEU|nr:hypothetical protein [Haloechinothrix aidingensis]
MNLTPDPEQTGAWLLAPVPHGAAFNPHHPSALTTPPNTTLEIAALARFQQIAHLGMNKLAADAELHDALVIGSGPVALGCVLELHRRGAQRVRVLTTRRDPPVAAVPGVVLVAATDTHTADVVIDATGQPHRATAWLNEGGVLGLLGTPNQAHRLAALPMHRSGWTVHGMHELASYDHAHYREAYATCARWLTSAVTPHLTTACCRLVPGAHAPQLFEYLQRPHARPTEPILILEWQ